MLPAQMVLAEEYSTAVEGSFASFKGSDSDAGSSVEGREFEARGTYYFNPVAVKGSLTHRDYEQRISNVSIGYTKINEDDKQSSGTANNSETGQEVAFVVHVPNSPLYAEFDYQKIKVIHGALAFIPEETENIKLNLLSLGGFVYNNVSIGMFKLQSKNSFVLGTLDLDLSGPFVRDIQNSGPNYFGYQLAAIKGDFGNSALRIYSKVRMLDAFYALENKFQVGVSYQKLSISNFAENKQIGVNFIYAITHSMTVEFERSKSEDDSSEETKNMLQLGVHF